jgi:hypothetical protein
LRIAYLTVTDEGRAWGAGAEWVAHLPVHGVEVGVGMGVIVDVGVPVGVAVEVGVGVGLGVMVGIGVGVAVGVTVGVGVGVPPAGATTRLSTIRLDHSRLQWVAARHSV